MPEPALGLAGRGTHSAGSFLPGTSKVGTMRHRQLRRGARFNQRPTSPDRRRRVTINRAVPNISSDLPAETRDFFVDLLGFEVAMDMGWVVTLASPTNPSVQVTIVGNEDPAAPGISVEVADVDAVHARAVERGLEIAYPLRDEEWGVRRFMLREPSGTTVNVLSHRPG
jgi:catechol 2,3-dioxygenase-like lactoylglutathione lyase family enzyme